MNCRVLICLGLFVLINWNCYFQPKDPRAEDKEEVSIAVSSPENGPLDVRENTEFLQPVPLDEGQVISVLYPDYFVDVFDTELSELVGVDYLKDEFSPRDRHTIEEVEAFSLPDDQELVLLHWSPINGPGSQVTEFFVISYEQQNIVVISRSDVKSRLEYGGGTILTKLPKPVSIYAIAEGQLAFEVSQVMRHAPSDSYNEEVYLMLINSNIIRQVFDYKAFSGHSRFRLRDEIGATQKDLIQIGTMIPNHVFRTGIEQIESKLQFMPNLTNGHHDFMLKQETFQLTDDLKEIRYDLKEMLFQFDGTAYVESGRVSS